MDIEKVEKELTEAKKKQVEVVAEINALEQRKQERLQEALKLEGEIRALTRLANKKDNGRPRTD
jgi:hypothetical protein